MKTLDTLREGLHQTLDTLSEGWRHLANRASQAMTRFYHPGGDLQTSDEQFMARSADWGLLAGEVSETDKEVRVKLEVPGMDNDGFDIHVVENHFLVVSGEKQVEREENRGHYFLMERAYGRFERTIPLPADVTEEGAKARYKRGVLTITLNKQAPHKQRRIKVETV